MSQVTTRFIEDNAVTGEKIRLDNNEPLRAKTSTGLEKEILKVDSSNVVQLLSLPQVSSDPMAANDLVRKSYLDSSVSGAVAGIQLEIDALEFAIEAEEQRAMAKEHELEMAIEAEESRAMAAEYALGQEIQTKVPLAFIGAPSGVAPLGTDQKIPSQYLPAIALTEVYVVSSLQARDALVVQSGDVAKVTSDGKTYIYDGSIWIELTADDAVDSVNGKTGHVVLNSGDIAEFGDYRYFTAAREQEVKMYADQKVATEAMERSYQDGLIRSEFAAADNVVRQEFAAADQVILQSAKSYTDQELFSQVTSQKGQPNGYASLDSAGKLNVSQLPALAITEVYVVQSQADRNALNPMVQSGDVVKVIQDHLASDGITYLARTYIRAVDSFGNGEWIELTTESDVDSVNGKVGHVVLGTADINESFGGPLYFTDTRARTAAVVDSILGGEHDKAPSVFAAKGYIDEQLDGLEVQEQAHQYFMLNQNQLTSITLSSPIVGTPWITIDGTMLAPNRDYTFSGSTITFIGPMLQGGETALVVGDELDVFYMKKRSPYMN